MRYGLVINNVIAQIEQENPVGKFHPSLVWVPVPDDAVCGWHYFNEQVLPPDDYRIMRINGPYCYAPIAEQLDMMYKDKVNGTNTWVDHIAQVKTQNPKPTT